MNQFMKRLAVGSLILFLLAFLLIELSTDEARLEGDPARPVYGSARLAPAVVRQLSLGEQTKRKPSSVSNLFRNNCARCHGADGRADTPLGRTYQTPNLTDPEWWRKNSKITSTANLISIVTKGKGGMPAFGKKLKRSEIRLLVNHLRRFRNPKP